MVLGYSTSCNETVHRDGGLGGRRVLRRRDVLAPGMEFVLGSVHGGILPDDTDDVSPDIGTVDSRYAPSHKPYPTEHPPL